MSEILSNILSRSGTDQEQRYIEALNPDSFELHDFSVEDWILFAYHFSENVHFFSTKNYEEVLGNWKGFFEKLTTSEIPFRGTRAYDRLKSSISETLAAYTNTSELTPHLALFVCFLQLLEFSKERFNKLTKRHLDFYYKEILQVDKKAPVPDQAHVIFELAKKVSDQKIEKGTALNAKKDVLGNPLLYTINEEFIANKATVGALKTVYNSNTENYKVIKASGVANTADGIATPLSEEAPYWYPFGYPSSDEKSVALPNASMGFSIAAPVLFLQEGYRTVNLKVSFVKSFENVSFQIEEILSSITLKASGKEDWITPELILINGENSGTIDFDKQVEFTFVLDHDLPSLVNYDAEVLSKNYTTDYPIVEFVFDVATATGYDFYRLLVGNIVNDITIHTHVKGITSLAIENDNGKIKTHKPFHPFTTRPIKGSNFTIAYDEAFSKKWKNFKVDIVWKNTPENFTTWYEAYINSNTYTSVSDLKSLYITSNVTPARKSTAYTPVESEYPVAFPIFYDHKIVANEGYFKAKKRILHKAGVSSEMPETSVNLFVKNINGDNTVYTTSITTVNPDLYATGKATHLQLSLEQTFLHEMYSRLYAMTVSSQDETLPIPNEPYTPLVESIAVSYEAEESITMKNANIEGDRIQLFHNHPFGECEENYAKKKYLQEEKGIREIYDKNTIQPYLVPKYCLGGHLYIGLKNVAVLQNISLLIQVLEGSENPDVPSFTTNERIDWSILCSDKWLSLENHILANNINNFLASGIITFSIPKETTSTNTLLPEGFVWLRARMQKSFDAVCKVINVHTQATVVSFKNNNNDVSHLKNGLPSGTIEKLITRKPQIKSISQPYNAFGGSEEETDENFYRRISERLRHKNRAITLWDYERLILQQFPEIYKVKCLNHTCSCSFNSAGNVTLVVVPDTVNKNVFDIYEPRVSTATLNTIQSYINGLNSMHVNAEVINPNYEKVRIELEVQFHKGYDENYYQKELQKAITKFLSPWAFDETKAVTFGIKLHKSVLINYIEKLPYVDYIQHVKMNGNATIHTIAPSTPKSILVSDKEHRVSTVLTTCKGIKPITEQKCLL